MEIEFFVKPEESDQWHAYWVKRAKAMVDYARVIT